VTARFTVPCARCLEPATVEVRSSFATTFVPAGASAASTAGDDPDLATYEGDELDLGDLVRQQVVLGIPISALCRADCQGLCPQCGKELNLGPCRCPKPIGSLGEAMKLQQQRKAARKR
jgi:uncharacterized protein